MRARLAVPVLAALLLLPACGKDAEQTAQAPARVETTAGEVPRIELEAEAARRLGLETAPVERAAGGAVTVPYSALLYDPDGGTWVYASHEPLAFVRIQVVVERIEGDAVLLAAGPAPGTPVVTVGVAELYGAELGIG